MRALPALVPLLLLLHPVFGQAPARTENVVISILAFNGRDYSPTFVRQGTGTIYLIAGADSFLSFRKTFVYFWPLTGEWKTDTESLDIPLDGTLEIMAARGTHITLNASRYTYYNQRGEYQLNWRVAREGEAEKVWADWAQSLAAYQAAVRKYHERQALQDAERSSLLMRVQELRAQGKDAASLVERVSNMADPEEPRPPQNYIVPPARIQRAFILNLAPGEYSLRLRALDGSIIEGSEKTLVVHEKRRSSGTGYEVIPGEKWTRPVESSSPSAVLYVDGSSDLYLRPYSEDEYNDLYYARTVNNEAQGNPNLMKWERIQQIPRATIRLVSPGSSTTLLHEQPWLVEQVPGGALGYRIVPFDAQATKDGKEPSLIAFRVRITPQASVMTFQTLDRDGKPAPGSTRQIRVITPPRLEIILPMLALLPLVAMMIVLILRVRRLRRPQA